MQQIKNDMNDWRSKLQELEALPSDAAWAKLDDRLSHAKSSKKPVLFWMAAAITCGLVFWISFLFMKKTIVQPVAHVIQKNILYSLPDVVKNNHVSTVQHVTTRKKE